LERPAPPLPVRLTHPLAASHAEPGADSLFGNPS
jgi:hypothetical protein